MGPNVTRTFKFSLQKREWCLIMSWCRCSDIMNDDLYRGWVILEEPVSGKRLAKRIPSINMAICSYEDNVDRPLSRLITLEHICRRRFMAYFSVALVTMFRPTFSLWRWDDFEWNLHVPVRSSSIRSSFVRQQWEYHVLRQWDARWKYYRWCQPRQNYYPIPILSQRTTWQHPSD